MKTNSIGKSFTIEKILKIDFQNFHISWKASKSISWTFIGGLHNETIVKYAFHEMLGKKCFFLIYLQTNLFQIIQLIQNSNASYKIMSKGTGQLMSNILVHPPMNYFQQVIAIRNYTYSSH